MASDDVKNTSTVVVALPARGEDVLDFGPEQKHATLLWFGEIDDFTAGWINAQIMHVLSGGMGPFTEQVATMTELGEDDPRATVLKLEPGMLKGIRERLLESPEVRKAWESIKQYPDFTPHVTLGYGDELSDDDRDDAPAVVKTITFDRLGLWHKDKQIEYPFDARLETVVAGAPKIVRTAEGAKRYNVPIGTTIEVDDKGKVTRTKATISDKPAAVTPPPPPRPDEDRTPTKFVPTRPGQKAKLPSGIAGGDSSSNGLTPAAASSVTNYTRILDAIGEVSPAQDDAMDALRNSEALSPGQKAALRAMIESIFRSMLPKKSEESKSEEKSEGKKGEEQTAAEKAATAKAQEASSKSTSAEKQAAQAKAQKAASEKSAWLRSLKAAYAALGGNPNGLPAADSASAGSATKSSPAATSGPASDSAGAKKLPTSGFSGMGAKELTGAIRSLMAAQKADPNSSKIKNALRMARAVRDRRARDKAEREAGRADFLAESGGSR